MNWKTNLLLKRERSDVVPAKEDTMHASQCPQGPKDKARALRTWSRWRTQMRFGVLKTSGCAGSVLLLGLSLVAASGAPLWLWCQGVSLQGLLGAEHGLWGPQAQRLLLLGSRAHARWLRCTGFVAPQHVGSSRIGNRTCLLHWQSDS